MREGLSMGKGIFRLLRHCRDSERGNIFFTLFGAVALVGAVGAASMTVMKGPVKGISDITRRTVAENNIIASSRLAITSSVDEATYGDCDSDGYIEPVMFEAQVGSEPVPTGGGHLPEDIGAQSKDPWGTRYGYCIWDHGPAIMNAACQNPPGTNRRLAGANSRVLPVVAVMSAGPDRVFQTSCRAFSAADANANGIPDPGEETLLRVAGSDDIVISYTYAEANATAGDIWRLKGGDDTTAEIAKNLEVRDAGGAVTASINSTTGMGDFSRINVDNIYAKTNPNGTTQDLAYLRLMGRSGSPPAGMAGGMKEQTSGSCIIDAGNIYGIAHDGTYLYVADPNNVRAYQLSGNTFTLLATQSISVSSGTLVVKNGKIFLGSSSSIRAYSFNGTAFTALGSQATPFAVNGIWANDTHVFAYYGTSGNTGFAAYTHAGSTFTPAGTFSHMSGGSGFSPVLTGKGNGPTATLFSTRGSSIDAISYDGATFTWAGSAACLNSGSVNYQEPYLYASCKSNGLRVFTHSGSTFTQVATYHPGGAAAAPGNSVSNSWANGNYVYTVGDRIRKTWFTGSAFHEIANYSGASASGVNHINGNGNQVFISGRPTAMLTRLMEINTPACGGTGDGGSPPLNTLDSLSCTNNQIPKWNGTAWACAADADSNTLAGLACPNGQIVKRVAGAWACAADAQAAGGDNLGNHTATANLAMATRNIGGIGTITATAYYISSDRNLKDNIRDIVDPHGLLEAVHGRHYTWQKDGVPAFGVIAQDVNSVMPEAVQKTEDGTLAVEYDQLLPAMIEATKDLKVQNDRLRAEIEALKQQTP